MDLFTSIFTSQILKIACASALFVRFRDSSAGKFGAAAAALWSIMLLLQLFGRLVGWIPVFIFEFVNIAAYACLLAGIISIPVTRTSKQSTFDASNRLRQESLPAQNPMTRLRTSTEAAKLVVLGSWFGTLQLTVRSGELEKLDREALGDVYHSLQQLAGELGLTEQLAGNYDQLPKVIEQSRSEHDKYLFETGQLIVAFAYPDNAPTIEDLRKLEWGMKMVGITEASDILSPLRSVISQQDPAQEAVAFAAYQVLTEVSSYLDGKHTESTTESGNDLTMGDLIHSALKEHSPAKNSSDFTTESANCLFLGFWAGQILLIANIIDDGDPDFITNLFGEPAEQAMPYIEKLGIDFQTITHGFNAISKLIESRYSSQASAAYEIGHLLAAAANPDGRFRSTLAYQELKEKLGGLGLESLSQMEDLKRQLETTDKEQISPNLVLIGVNVLTAIANALETKA